MRAGGAERQPGSAARDLVSLVGVSTRLPFVLVTAALVGCEATGGGASSSGGVRVTESGTKRGSAGSFSATLAAELGPPEGSLGAAAPGATTAVPAPAGGSATTAGSATVTGSATTSAEGSATRGSAATTSAAGSVAPVGAGSAVAAAGSAVDAPKGSASDAVASAADVPVPAAKGKRVYVKPPADLAAIKLDLEPNWERDMGEAGTFSLVVKVPSSDDTRVFSVRYGYEDPSAPFDCDGYRKFLEDKKAMTVTLNRQRGGGCYVEATDKGAATFRYLVSYGGKLLTCQGSLYKDAASSSLGDLRDKVLMQAKKICETLAL